VEDGKGCRKGGRDGHVLFFRCLGLALFPRCIGRYCCCGGYRIDRLKEVLCETLDQLEDLARGGVCGRCSEAGSDARGPVQRRRQVLFCAGQEGIQTDVCLTQTGVEVEQTRA